MNNQKTDEQKHANSDQSKNIYNRREENQILKIRPQKDRKTMAKIERYTIIDINLPGK